MEVLPSPFCDCVSSTYVYFSLVGEIIKRIQSKHYLTEDLITLAKNFYMDIKYLKGDATQPVGNSNRIILHVCNDIIDLNP